MDASRSKLMFCRLLYRASKLPVEAALPMASILPLSLMSMGSYARGPFSSRHTLRASPSCPESSAICLATSSIRNTIQGLSSISPMLSSSSSF